ncbi:hypothetical protein [Paenibacillus sp. F4]|uniref:hypothetical protein n=1 Tax=Paenibacillus sp. F4 TaxID=357385 RepID=UPI000C9FBBDB|nr:hypothetical protein [Paenibacillus sp. F4]PNQ79676.1 hypothetical protein C1T21_16840 [Paenibacillus sp. F4]
MEILMLNANDDRFFLSQTKSTSYRLYISDPTKRVLRIPDGDFVLKIHFSAMSFVDVYHADSTNTLAEAIKFNGSNNRSTISFEILFHQIVRYNYYGTRFDSDGLPIHTFTVKPENPYGRV